MKPSDLCYTEDRQPRVAEGPSWLYKILENLFPQKLIRVFGYLSHKDTQNNSYNACADLPTLYAQRQQNVVHAVLITEQSSEAGTYVGSTT